MMKWIVLLLVTTGAALAADPATHSFNRDAWLKDYAYLKQELERSYSHLAWIASPGSGVDLLRLARRTQMLLETAETDGEARAAIVAFVAGFHDGHFAPVPVLDQLGTAVAVAKPELGRVGPMDGCAALGYVPERSIAFTLPFDTLRGFSMQSDGVSRTFRAGIATSSAGTRFGVVRIPRFRDRDAPPATCVAIWTALQKSRKPVDPDAVRKQVSAAWFRTLAGQLRNFREQKVAAVIVDIGGNTGGNDSGDWAARLFTPTEVRSARLFVVAEPSSARYFDEQLEGIRAALAGDPRASQPAREKLQKALAVFEERKASIASRNCDMSWVWKEQRPWQPGGCSRLVDAGHASGHEDYLPADALGSKELATSIYWAAEVDEFRGAWSGPVYVLTDGKTASSAEMFSAVMRDNDVARTVGERTEGDGCGFMYDRPALELPNSRLRFLIPNCVRLRADQTDEVAGIAPDLPILPSEGEDARSRAARLLETVDADLRSRHHSSTGARAAAH